jgi:hypothetical protein
LELTQILSDESGKFDVNVRVAAGLASKNCLVARDLYRRQQLIEQFKGIDPTIKGKIKEMVKREIGVCLFYLCVLFLGSL